MEPSNVNALFYPFENGDLSWPEKGQSACYINAQYSEHLSKLKNCSLDLHQYNYSYTHNLQKEGYQSNTELEENSYDYGLINIPKDILSAKIYVAEMLSRLKDGGTLVCAARNDAGGKRLEKFLADMGCTVRKISKFKCTICIATKSKSINQEAIRSIMQQNKLTKNDFGYWTIPGVYGREKIDTGSNLLSNSIDNLEGVGADLGCGYGFLSITALRNFKGISKLYMVDNDYRAILSSKKNIEESFKQKNVEYMWADINKLNFGQKLDWVIMNPPFHQSKETSLNLGLNFITCAYNALRKDGALWVVSNSHLAYEKHIFSLFSSAKKQKEENGFKVYCARK